MPQKRNTRRRERRIQPRVDARLSMRVEGTPEEGALSQVVTESQNISSSGVYCMSPHFLPPLSKVALTIVLPRIPGGVAPQELLKCEGIVVRCEPSGRRQDQRWELACMFSGLADSWRRRIDEFVTWRNLQALREAAGIGNGARTTRRRTAPATAAKRAAPKRRTGAKSARRKTSRGTVH